MGAHEVLEHSEHIAHAGHGGHDDHGHFGTYVGITMAILGVLLAFCAAKVGGERTELVQTLVAQQNAHAKYQAQNMKHRIAVLDLQTIHALGGPGGANLDKKDVVGMVSAVDRYFHEAETAKEWLESYDPAIEAHVEAQERYETGQLCAEIGIVIASVALLMKKRPAWYVALALGVGAVGITATTYAHTKGVMSVADQAIEEKGKAYATLRKADKAAAQDDAMIDELRRWADAPAAAAHKEE